MISFLFLAILILVSTGFYGLNDLVMFHDLHFSLCLINFRKSENDFINSKTNLIQKNFFVDFR